MRSSRVLVAPLLALTLAGCGVTSSASREMGNDGVSPPAPKTLGVNAYLWQASLDTLSFLPLASTDPFGGLIISGWYTASSSPDERIKVMVHIMDRGLRADGLKIAVFRQERHGTEWRDAKATPYAARKLEDAILTRARELRLATRAPQRT